MFRPILINLLKGFINSLIQAYLEADSVHIDKVGFQLIGYSDGHVFHVTQVNLLFSSKQVNGNACDKQDKNCHNHQVGIKYFLLKVGCKHGCTSLRFSLLLPAFFLLSNRFRQMRPFFHQKVQIVHSPAAVGSL